MQTAVAADQWMVHLAAWLPGWLLAAFAARTRQRAGSHRGAEGVGDVIRANACTRSGSDPVLDESRQPVLDERRQQAAWAVALHHACPLFPAASVSGDGDSSGGRRRAGRPVPQVGPVLAGQRCRSLTVCHKHRHNCGHHKDPGYLCMTGGQAGRSFKVLSRCGVGERGGSNKSRCKGPRARGDHPRHRPPLPARRQGGAALLPWAAHPAGAGDAAGWLSGSSPTAIWELKAGSGLLSAGQMRTHLNTPSRRLLLLYWAMLSMPC